ncbi:unnamed protein product [Thelazia callipaeda]|uniref:DH domain-containing protein n=1 Tax=Thelazia callipaeda TaxID=103827 RepID=A0A0N5CM01_THECL|nr:unnamed protein product [Thelazia callipaeda]
MLKLEPEDFTAMDRQLLNKDRIHSQTACLERLYLPMDVLEYGLHNVEQRSELMLLQLHNVLVDTVPYLKTKHNLTLIVENVLAAQKAFLHSEVEKKIHHAKVYKMGTNKFSSIVDSSK